MAWIVYEMTQPEMDERVERIRKEERTRIKIKIFNYLSAFEYSDSRMKLESDIEEIFAQLEK